MPELPEVETVVRTLRPALCGRTITGVRAGPFARRLRLPWKPAWRDRLASRRILGVRRRGKWIIVDLKGGEALLFHLGMTGRLRVVLRQSEWAKHAHLGFALVPGEAELRFEDVRRFGAVRVLPTGELGDFFSDAKLGLEPDAFSSGWLFERLRGTRRCVKAVLLDQRVIAGVGNIYADESLFEAKLHPARLACDVSLTEADGLRRAIVRVLRRAIEKHGSTIRDYVDGNGQSGGYQHEFRVYDRTGQPCPRCRTPIARIRLAGRSTHFCPQCQT